MTSPPCAWYVAHDPHPVGFHVTLMCPGRQHDATPRSTMTEQPEHLVTEPTTRGTRVRDRQGDTWRRGTTRWTCEAPVDGDRVQRVGRLPWYALVTQYGPLTFVSEPLSAAQVRMLRSLHECGDFPYVRGMQANGGLEQTRMALVRKRLIEFSRDADQWVLTDAGERALS